MSRIERPDEVQRTLDRQNRPDAVGTLKRVDCELTNLLQSGTRDLALGEDWYEALEDLHAQVKAAIAG